MHEPKNSNSLDGKPCPDDKIIYDYETEEYVCLTTGEVVKDRFIDDNPEWRAFTPEEAEKRRRVGGPLTNRIHDMGIVTIIDRYNRDATGKILKPHKKLEAQKLRIWQSKTRIWNSHERSLVLAMKTLDRISELLSLPRNVKEEAARIYRKAVEKGLVRGRKIKSTIVASIYIACRELRIPRTLDEIAQNTGENKKDIARCYRLLLRELGIKIHVVDPVDLVPRIVYALKLSSKVTRKAVEILRKAQEKGITCGKDPAGLAASSVYIASLLVGEHRTQKEVAQVSGVTEVTVRNRHRELAKKLGIKLPNPKRR